MVPRRDGEYKEWYIIIKNFVIAMVGVFSKEY